MSDTGTETVRGKVRQILQPLLVEAEAIFKLVTDHVRVVESQNDEWLRLYNRLELASGAFPFAPYHNHYFDGLNQATEPLFHSLLDKLSERYFEMPAAEIEGLREQYVVPANKGVKDTFDRAKALYVRVASEAAIVRRLSGYEDLLAQLGNALKPPWATGPDQKYRNYGRRFPYWVATMTQATPFHRGLMALREANENTLRLIHDALQSLIAILRSMIAELDFAELLAKPVPMPRSLILIQQNVDASTSIGDGASIRDAAVGKGAQKQGR